MLFSFILEDCCNCTNSKKSSKTPPSSPTDPTSYRPIPLINFLSKLTEAFIAPQLNAYIQDNNIISPVQFGFRERLSAPHHVYRLIEHITIDNISKIFTAAVFLDIEKAYNKVWILGLLIFKLINYNSPTPYLIKLIYHFLLDWNFHVRFKGKLSRNLFARSNLPQCLRISCMLFNHFINKMAIYPHTFLAKYADDTCVFSINQNRRYAILAITLHLTAFRHGLKRSVLQLM